MRFLLTLFAVGLVSWALWVIARRQSGRRETSARQGTARPSSARPSAGTSTRWTRQDRLALASLVVGTLLGMLALLKP